MSSATGGRPGFFVLRAVIPLLGHEQAMPPQDGVRYEQRAHRLEHLTAEDFAFDGQSTTLIIA
jgi:hypothetical protein